VCALAVLTLSTAVSSAARAQAPAVDPEAVELLRRTTEWVSSLQQFSVDAQSTFEDLLDSGHRVDYELSGTALVSRPNRLRTERHGRQINQIFYFDGETLTLHNPADEVYAAVSAPGTIDDVFWYAYDSLGIGVPISDLMHADPFPLLMEGVTFAAVIGQEVIAGVECHHLLFSRPGVDFQIWVADSGPPVPLKYVVTDTGTPELLSISTVISNWDLAPSVHDSLFTFVPPQGTTPIVFLKDVAGSGPSR
jgi:hypothetical protein